MEWTDPKSALKHKKPVEEPRLFDDGLVDTRAGDWRDLGDLQRSLCSLRADALPEAGSTGDGLGHEQGQSE